VEAFLKDKIKFTEISEIIEKTVNKINFANRSDIETYLNTDKEARIIAKELIK